MTRLIRAVLLPAMLAVSLFTPAQAQMSESELVNRLNRLENMVRQLTGQVEQLQFRNQQLEQQLARGAPQTIPARPSTPHPQSGPPLSSPPRAYPQQQASPPQPAYPQQSAPAVEPYPAPPPAAG